MTAGDDDRTGPAGPTGPTAGAAAPFGDAPGPAVAAATYVRPGSDRQLRETTAAALAGEVALALLEVSSIARGVVAADAMAKRAPVRLLASHPTSPGKHVILLAGGVAEVEEALEAGLAAAGATLVDRLFLPQAHPSLPSLVAAGTNGAAPARLEAVCVFEAYTIAAALLAADAAAKAAEVTLVDLRLGQGLGGKAYFTMTGEQADVEAAADAGRAAIEAGLVVAVETIAAPHEDLRRGLFW